MSAARRNTSCCWSQFEHRAQAYVDPDSGFVFLQVTGSMLAGAIYYTAPSFEAAHWLDAQTSPNFSASGCTERRRREPPIRLPPSDDWRRQEATAGKQRFKV
jgi:hypothetical protein